MSSFDFFNPRHELLIRYFDTTKRERNNDRSEKPQPVANEHYDRLAIILKFRKDFVAKYKHVDIGGLDLEGGDFSDIKSPDDFVEALENVSLSYLKRFLNGFVAHCAIPLETSFMKETRRMSEHVGKLWVTRDAEVMRDLHHVFKKDPSEALIEKNQICVLLSAFITAISYFHLANNFKERYDAACKAGNAQEQQDALGFILFGTVIAAISTVITIYNAYKWYIRDTAPDKSAGASNENFLQWLETSASAAHNARPRLLI